MDRIAITDADRAAAEEDDTFRHAGDEGEAGSSVAGDGDDDDEPGGAGYQPLWVRLACIGLDFLTQTYDQIRIVPEIVLFEQYVCRSYHAGDGSGHAPFPGGRIPHELCKNPDVQYQLARLRSYKALFDGIASKLSCNLGWSLEGRCLSTDNFPQVLITAIPMGVLADRVGRKKVIASSVLGPMLQLCWILLVCRSIYFCLRTRPCSHGKAKKESKQASELTTIITSRQAWEDSRNEA